MGLCTEGIMCQCSQKQSPLVHAKQHGLTACRLPLSKILGSELLGWVEVAGCCSIIPWIIVPPMVGLHGGTSTLTPFTLWILTTQAWVGCVYNFHVINYQIYVLELTLLDNPHCGSLNNPYLTTRYSRYCTTVQWPDACTSSNDWRQEPQWSSTCTRWSSGLSFHLPMTVLCLQ